MDRLRSIEAFVRVADTRSFAEAARQLGVAKSVVTTRIQQLEDFVQAQLFHRTTRAVQLSTTGAAIYAECAELVTRTAQLVDHTRDLRGAPSGVLRVHALPGFAIGRFGDLRHAGRAQAVRLAARVLRVAGLSRAVSRTGAPGAARQPPARAVLALPDARHLGVHAAAARREGDLCGVRRSRAVPADQQRAPAARLRVRGRRHRLPARPWSPPTR